MGCRIACETGAVEVAGPFRCFWGAVRCETLIIPTAPRFLLHASTTSNRSIGRIDSLYVNLGFTDVFERPTSSTPFPDNAFFFLVFALSLSVSLSFLLSPRRLISYLFVRLRRPSKKLSQKQTIAVV